MPEICRFYGIIISFYYREHPPKHFHALVDQWRAIHLQELREDWSRARQQLPLLQIAPLD